MAEPLTKSYDELVRHRIGLERLARGTVVDIDRLLSIVQRDIEGKLAAELQRITSAPGTNAKRLEELRQLQAQIAAIQREAHERIRRRLFGDSAAVSQYEAEWAERFNREGLGIGTFVNVPSPELLESLVTQNPFQGEILREWASKMERAQLDRIWQQIRIGMVSGESVDQIIARLRGSWALNFRDGQFAKDRRGAEALVRTSINHATTQAHLSVLELNKELFPAYEWVSVLDRRTTVICRSRDGNVYVTGEGPVPPAHWNCRSTIIGIPAYKVDPKAISKDQGAKPIKTLSEPRFDEWLRRQPADEQKRLLGPARYELWKKGGLDVKTFADIGTGRALTLEQLRKLDDDAWRKAFGTSRVTSRGHIFTPTAWDKATLLEGEVLLNVPVGQLDALWKRAGRNYISPSKEGASVTGVGRTLATGEKIPIARLTFGPDGAVHVVGNRTGVAYARRIGEDFVPMRVTVAEAERIKRMIEQTQAIAPAPKWTGRASLGLQPTKGEGAKLIRAGQTEQQAAAEKLLRGEQVDRAAAAKRQAEDAIRIGAAHETGSSGALGGIRRVDQVEALDEAALRAMRAREVTRALQPNPARTPGSLDLPYARLNLLDERLRARLAKAGIKSDDDLRQALAKLGELRSTIPVPPSPAEIAAEARRTVTGALKGPAGTYTPVEVDKALRAMLDSNLSVDDWRAIYRAETGREYRGKARGEASRIIAEIMSKLRLDIQTRMR